MIYYSECLDLSLDAHLKPEVQKIAESNDIVELEKLLKLVLGLAVNCDDKQTYITQIMEMEESVQQNIMRALQEIENIGTPSSARHSLNLSSEMKDDLEKMAQKCHEKEKEIKIMFEEKTLLSQEVQRLQLMLDKFENPAIIGDNGESLGHALPGSVRMNDLRKQVDNLKNDLLLSETLKEDLKMKSIQQDKEVAMLRAKVDELTKASSELSQIKDEVDILREASEKSKIIEAQLATYKKKLEDYNDLKRQVKASEDRSAEYLKQNLQYEDDVKKFASLKGQMELYKKELEEVHAKLDAEMQTNSVLTVKHELLQTKVAGLQRERDNLMAQRDTLQEKVDELRCNPSGRAADDDDSANISREMLGDSLKERMVRLEAENKALREGQGGQTALSDLLNDANQRNEKLREQLKASSQKILLLTSQSVPDEEKIKIGLAESKEAGDEEIQSQVVRIRQLETSLEAKTQELTNLEIKYRKCVEKAKEVIKGLDPRMLGEAIEGASAEPPENDVMSVMESRLIASSFYRMALSSQRDSVDQRLASLSQGQSFLARQRQPPPRKNITPSMNYKKWTTISIHQALPSRDPHDSFNFRN